MKKFLQAILIGLLATSFTGCSTMSPSSLVEEELKEVKTKKPEEISQQLQQEYTDNEAINTFYKNVMDFEYKIVEEKVDGDKAAVTVEITTYPFGEKLEDAIVEAFDLALSGVEDEEVIATKMFEKLNDVSDKTYSKKLDISCVKKDGKWNVENLEENEELTDALLGGMVTVSQNLE